MPAEYRLVDPQERRQPRESAEAARAKLSASGCAREWRPIISEFRFILTIEEVDVLSDAAQEALFEAGCGDATFGISDGVQTGEFDREAADFSEAVASAIRAIETALVGARVVQVHREEDVAAPR